MKSKRIKVEQTLGKQKNSTSVDSWKVQQDVGRWKIQQVLANGKSNWSWQVDSPIGIDS